MSEDNNVVSLTERRMDRAAENNLARLQQCHPRVFLGFWERMFQFYPGLKLDVVTDAPAFTRMDPVVRALTSPPPTDGPEAA